MSLELEPSALEPGGVGDFERGKRESPSTDDLPARPAPLGLERAELGWRGVRARHALRAPRAPLGPSPHFSGRSDSRTSPVSAAAPLHSDLTTDATFSVSQVLQPHDLV